MTALTHTTLGQALSSYSEKHHPKEDCFVHFYYSQLGYVAIDPPVRANEFHCPFCDGDEFALYTLEQGKKAWMCRRVCEGSKMRKGNGEGNHPTPQKRAVEWPKFCDSNGLGDLKYDITFEKIQQPSARVDYLLKFAIHPVGLILMQGTKGNGKTYACLGVCEFYTRKNSSAVFTTQTEMQHDWLNSTRDHMNNYVQSVTGCNLLIVDDFGVGENPPGFMKFFFEMIDKRMQWSNRGTIITTNLDDKKFSEYCGEALSDRIGTGQKFLFKEKSRRTQLVL